MNKKLAPNPTELQSVSELRERRNALRRKLGVGAVAVAAIGASYMLTDGSPLGDPMTEEAGARYRTDTQDIHAQDALENNTHVTVDMARDTGTPTQLGEETIAYAVEDGEGINSAAANMYPDEDPVTAQAKVKALAENDGLEGLQQDEILVGPADLPDPIDPSARPE